MNRILQNHIQEYSLGYQQCYVIRGEPEFVLEKIQKIYDTYPNIAFNTRTIQHNPGFAMLVREKGEIALVP